MADDKYNWDNVRFILMTPRDNHATRGFVDVAIIALNVGPVLTPPEANITNGHILMSLVAPHNEYDDCIAAQAYISNAEIEAGQSPGAWLELLLHHRASLIQQMKDLASNGVTA